MEVLSLHCWKILNIEREYGTRKMYLIALIHAVLTFSFSYVFLNLFNYAVYDDRHFMYFVCVVLLIYPLHKLLHFLPLFRHRHKMSIRLRRRLYGIPTIHMRIKEPIPKRLYIFSLLFPFLVLTTILLIVAVMFPTMTHYASILLGVHALLCAFDYIYIKHLIHSPTDALIEETPRGYEILVPLS